MIRMRLVLSRSSHGNVKNTHTCFPGDIWPCLETLSLVGVMVLLAAGGESPGTVLNILQYTSQLPTTSNFLELKCQ